MRRGHFDYATTLRLFDVCSIARTNLISAASRAAVRPAKRCTRVDFGWRRLHAGCSVFVSAMSEQTAKHDTDECQIPTTRA
jgi:hypothetical protein